MSGVSMGVDLQAIAFDHYQRYGAASAILSTLGCGDCRILEVGANRQRLLGEFLPKSSLLYTDIRVEGDEQDFVVADATALPFQSGEYGAVVSLDVLEHIPRELRAAAVSEMGRVAGDAVVIGCPTDEEWVVQADAAANDRWKELFGDDYEWLQEHRDYGLVNAAEVVSILEGQGLHVVVLTQGCATLWESLMGVHFMKVKFPELEGLSRAADRLYNTRVFAGDCVGPCYRTYFIGLRNAEKAQELRDWWVSRGASDDQAVGLLEQLASGLRELALRTLNSELEWAATADVAKSHAKDLEVATREWSATIQRLETAEADVAKVISEWKSTAEANAGLQAQIKEIKHEWEQTVALFKRAQQDALNASEGWRQTIDACRQKDEDLRVAVGEWQSTAELLRLSEQKAAEAEQGRMALAHQLEQREQELSVTEASDETSQAQRDHALALESLEELRRELMETKEALSASVDAVRSRDEEIGGALLARDTSESLREAVETEMCDLHARLEAKLMAAVLAQQEQSRQHAAAIKSFKLKAIGYGVTALCVAMTAAFMLGRLLAN
ncbi:methyltransferase domain-containing protein [Xanthomonas citri pv. phaseoli var. fuscans]|nr:class I SAM-dependent methyltransferase [Xanthomonas citri]ATS40271.1 methyltransferase domain-containing protein [Xanthomonas citri pv. phaseoli var. fuscans]ATS44810.1 methyltransferase domain-containing protein [Xanthomonas citri pv. phaseoli var. fuscans]ATS48280.1 methyltransferase domain-containing protein [Xanthomonas citri pv. phaseoli var. fuscans]ATS85340.1 methyltransferase domain-containing protein [Xanthomonas citri pv. phaseoli var. fuscans]QWN21896.1 methyltransferase domain-